MIYLSVWHSAMCGNHRIQQYNLHDSVQPRNRHRHCKLWQVHLSGKKIINHHYEFSLLFAMFCQNVCTSISKARTLPSFSCLNFVLHFRPFPRLERRCILATPREAVWKVRLLLLRPIRAAGHWSYPPTVSLMN